MLLKAFSLLDTKTGMFNTPFFMAHTGQAIRACMDLGADLNTTVGRHPSDFALVEIGTFDDQSGVLAPQVPVQLGTVASFLPARVSPQGALFAHADARDVAADGEVLANGRA